MTVTINDQDIEQAFQNDEWVLYFQPQFSLSDLSYAGSEVLLRWNHPVEGLMLPNEFLPKVQQSPYFVTLSEWVIKKSIQQLQLWQRKGYPPTRLSINLSPIHLMHPSFLPFLQKNLHSSYIFPSQLQFEIIETPAITNFQKVRELIFDMKALGMSVAIDDFGSQHLDLAYLHLPVDAIKLDRQLIQGNEFSKTMAKHLMALFRDLGKIIIAEGVETKNHLKFVQSHPCDVVQGFYFAPPLPTDKIEVYLT